VPATNRLRRAMTSTNYSGQAQFPPLTSVSRSGRAVGAVSVGPP